MADAVMTEETTEPAEKQVTSDEMRKTIESEMAEKYRAEIAGLNRKITDLTKGFESVQKQKADAEMTLEERIKLLETENQKQATILERERRAGQIRDEAVKRNLPEKVVKSVLATDWSLDEAIVNMDELVADLKAVHDKSVNETLVSKSYKPRSGEESSDDSSTAHLSPEVKAAMKDSSLSRFK